MEQTELHSDQLVNVKVSIYPFLLNKKTRTNMGIIRKGNSKKKPYHKAISTVLLPSFFKYKTVGGQTPMMLLTTSRSPRRERSPVSTAMRRDCLDCIQSRCSAPFNWVTMNSVIENGSNIPKTTDAVFWRQRFNSLTSKMGSSTRVFV